MTSWLHHSYALCREITRVHARTFYLASRVLDKTTRYGAYAVYAFCRLADDIVDRAAIAEKAQLQEELAHFRHLLALLQEGAAAPDELHPWLPAFRDTIQRFAIPPELFAELLDGIQMDLEKTRYATFEELYTYCYRVASVVGMVMCYIFGYRSPQALEHAIEMGIAMQLTNILRDVEEDYRRGRIYLPLEELEAFGYTEEELARGVLNDAFRALMRFQIERARTYYRRAWRGIPLLRSRRGRICTRIMGRLYAGILDEIERAGYDVFRRRAAVSLPRKLLLGAQAALKHPGWPADVPGLRGWSGIALVK
nr:MAG: phytoene desaturase [Bacteroidota bacterium]